MKISTNLKSMIPLIVASAFLTGLAFLPRNASAVLPPPDGGYPGGNTAEGQAALLSLTSGGFNTGVGFLSLRSNTEANFNTAIGAGTLLANTGNQNTATGAGALLSNTTGEFNTANGAFSLFSNNTGSTNTANGAFALNSNTTGEFNTATGVQALLNNTTGFTNTAIGDQALVFNTSGNFNIALGPDAGANVTTANNVIAIGDDGENVSSSTWIGGIYGTTTVSGDTLPVIVSATGQLGTAASSRRFKKEIKPMDRASESILALKPVTFHYKSDKTSTPQFGLIAEEVAEENPGLVVRDDKGDIYTVRYDAVNAMLLNEFLKEHKRVQEQEATIAQLKKDFRATVAQLTARLEEQASQIQKVSDQVDMGKVATGQIRRGGPTTKVVLNNP